MSNVFNAAEVLDMGIEKERKRRDFYGLVAENFKEADMKDLFAKLRDWEDTHIKKFTEIRNSIESSEVAETYEGEFAAYVDALVNDILYNQISAGWFVKNVKTPIAAIRYGIGFEKDAILFFRELIGRMAPLHRDKVEELIEEEKKHLIYLSQLKGKYE